MARRVPNGSPTRISPILHGPHNGAARGFIGMGEKRTRTSQERLIQQMRRPPSRDALVRARPEVRGRYRDVVEPRKPKESKRVAGEGLCSQRLVTKHVPCSSLET